MFKSHIGKSSSRACTPPPLHYAEAASHKGPARHPDQSSSRACTPSPFHPAQDYGDNFNGWNGMSSGGGGCESRSATPLGHGGVELQPHQQWGRGQANGAWARMRTPSPNFDNYYGNYYNGDSLKMNAGQSAWNNSAAQAAQHDQARQPRQQQADSASQPCQYQQQQQQRHQDAPEEGWTRQLPQQQPPHRQQQQQAPGRQQQNQQPRQLPSPQLDSPYPSQQQPRPQQMFEKFSSQQRQPQPQTQQQMQRGQPQQRQPPAQPQQHKQGQPSHQQQKPQRGLAGNPLMATVTPGVVSPEVLQQQLEAFNVLKQRQEPPVAEASTEIPSVPKQAWERKKVVFHADDDDDEDLDLENDQNNMSRGSTGHPHQCNEPCKYHRKKRGCRDGPNCDHCHVCRWRPSVDRLLRRRARNTPGTAETVQQPPMSQIQQTHS